MDNLCCQPPLHIEDSICGICGHIITYRANDLRLLLTRSGSIELVEQHLQPGYSAHIFPEGDCPGTEDIALTLKAREAKPSLQAEYELLKSLVRPPEEPYHNLD